MSTQVSSSQSVVIRPCLPAPLSIVMAFWSSSVVLSRMIKFVFVLCVVHFAAEAFPVRSARSQYSTLQSLQERFGSQPQHSIPSFQCFMVTSSEDMIWGSREDDIYPPLDDHGKLVAEGLFLNLTASVIRRLPSNTRFKYRIRQLLEHKLKYGDYEIATEMSGLKQWIRTQRYEYRMRMQGKDSLLTPERVDLLNKIGFDWKLESQDGLTTTWLQSYEELKTFYKEHGHAKARASALTKWLSNQRYQYKRWKQGESRTSMTDKRREMLDDVGMVWDYRGEEQTKYDDQWQESYEQLVEFQKENGHCFVPQSSGRLGRWIMNQRKAYQNRLKYNVSTLTEKRETLLRDIGFDFDVDGFTTWHNRLWEANYKELQEFYKNHNHVSCRSSLGYWVSKQRQEYRRLQEGKPSTMTQERIEALEKLEFAWTCKEKSRRRTIQNFEQLRDVYKEYNGTHFLLDPEMGPWIKRQRLLLIRARHGEETTLTEEQIEFLEDIKIHELLGMKARIPWETCLEQLASFQSRHGHTRVPRSFDDSLFRWNRKQRLQYRQREDGKKSPMTLERIEKLESLGFEWTSPYSRYKIDRPPKQQRRRKPRWEIRLEQLTNFQSTHGHTRVPSWYDASLYGWIGQQRVQYRRWKYGKESPITPERIEKLESLGFEWTVPIGRPKVDRLPIDPTRRGRPRKDAS